MRDFSMAKPVEDFNLKVKEASETFLAETWGFQCSLGER